MSTRRPRGGSGARSERRREALVEVAPGPPSAEPRPEAHTVEPPAPRAPPSPPPPRPELAREPPLPAIADERRRDREGGERRGPAIPGDGRVGDETVDAPELAALGSFLAARHLMVLFAKKRREPRGEVLAAACELLIATGDPIFVRRVLVELPEAGRIVDIYPLEVLAYVLERRPDLVDGFAFEPFVHNRRDLESRTFGVEEPIPIAVPLALRMRGFALEGGGTPGYCLQPGPPGAYLFELGEAGTFRLLLRGEIRRRALVDRVVLRVEDPPGAG